MNTFGRIDWHELYSLSERHRAAEAKERREVEVLLKVLTRMPPECPCSTCPRDELGCKKTISCSKFSKWVYESWPIVTNRLKGDFYEEERNLLRHHEGDH